MKSLMDHSRRGLEDPSADEGRDLNQDDSEVSKDWINN